MLVSPTFVTVSPLRDLKVCLTQPPSAIPRLSLGRRGEEQALALHDVLFLPSAFPAPLMKLYLFCKARMGERMTCVNADGWQTLATSQGGLGGDILLLGWCHPPVSLERSQRLSGKRARTDSAAGEGSSSVGTYALFPS